MAILLGLLSRWEKNTYFYFIDSLRNMKWVLCNLHHTGVIFFDRFHNFYSIFIMFSYSEKIMQRSDTQGIQVLLNIANFLRFEEFISRCDFEKWIWFLKVIEEKVTFSSKMLFLFGRIFDLLEKCDKFFFSPKNWGKVVQNSNPRVWRGCYRCSFEKSNDHTRTTSRTEYRIPWVGKAETLI